MQQHDPEMTVEYEFDNRDLTRSDFKLNLDINPVEILVNALENAHPVAPELFIGMLEEFLQSEGCKQQADEDPDIVLVFIELLKAVRKEVDPESISDNGAI